MSARSGSHKVYGPAKTHERSVRCSRSTNRRYVRAELDAIRRRARRTTRSRLSTYHGPADTVLNAFAEDEDAGLLGWPTGAIAYTVTDRRCADKVGPLRAWGRARTRHLPQDQRLDALRSVLPNTLLGRHALSHLAWLPDLRDPADPP